MTIKYEHQVSLGIMAGTLATWVRDNPQAQDVDNKGVGDADEFGMYALATGFLRMYYELLDNSSLSLLQDLKTPPRSTH